MLKIYISFIMFLGLIHLLELKQNFLGHICWSPSQDGVLNNENISSNKRGC